MLSFTNKLLQYILEAVEVSPDCLFRENELRQISADDFNLLFKDKLLEFHRYNPEGSNFPCQDQAICGSTCDRIVSLIKGKWEAVCPDSSSDVIPITQDDIESYSFNIDRFVEIIRSDNNLAESLSRLDDRLYFIGSLNVKSKSTAIILALCSNPKTAGTLLLSIPSRTARYQAGIVLMPFFDEINQNTRRIVEDRNIHLVNFAEAFGQDNLVIIQDVLAKVTQKEKSISFSKAKKSKTDLSKCLFQYNDKKLPPLRNKIHKLLLKILDRVFGKNKDTYIPLKDIVKACGWKIEDYNREPENYKNRISGIIRELNKALKSVGLPRIGRLDSEKGYLCPIAIKDVAIIPPTSSGKARPNIKRLEEFNNTPSSENE